VGFGSPPLTAKEVWEYVTRVLTNLPDERAARIDNLDMLVSRTGKFSELDTLKALFFKRAESLDSDDGSGTGWSVDHGAVDSDDPFHTRLITGAELDSEAMSYASPPSDYYLTRLLRLPGNLEVSKLIFECRLRLAQTSNVMVKFGLGDPATTDIATDSTHAVFHFDSSVSPYWRTSSYGTAQELTVTDVATDTAWHTFRIEITSSDVKFYVDGALKATHTQVPNAGSPDFINSLIVILRTLEDGVKKELRYDYVAAWVEV